MAEQSGNPGKLKPCPVCGRIPKIQIYGVNTGWAECKPLFRKEHLSVFVPYARPSELIGKITEQWNRMADNG